MAESKLARSLRVKLQLRDKKGRWIEMGRGGKWYSSLEGKEKSGIVIGSKGNTAVMREKNADGTLGTKNIDVPMNQLEMIPSKASLDPASLKLMNEFKNNQSSKGQKESDARESALATAKDNYAKGVSIDDEAEVEYEVSAQEELEDLLDNAPQGAMLLKNDGASKAHSLKKGKNNNWEDGLYAPLPSNAIANSPSYAKNYEYVGGGETAKKVNDLFDEIANNKPVKEKKGWFGKKKKDAASNTDVDPLDNLIKSTDEMLAEFDKNQNSSINTQNQAPAPAAPEAPEAVVSPEPEALIDISQWKYHQGTQGGSNPGGIYSDSEGNQHYVKHSKSDMHAKNEVMADKFYEKLGIKTSQLKLADVGDGKLGTSSKMVPGSKNDFYSKAMSDPAYKKKFQEDFAADAWLANWDVVGLEYDNVLSDENGDAIRIDPGGALLYRAMGSPKGDMFGDEVGEWESMRNGSNPASKIFGSMTDEDLKNSAAKLNNISDQDIADIVDSMEFEPDVADYLKNTLAARKKNILDKFPEIANEQNNVLPQEELPQDAVAEVPVAPDVVPEAAVPDTSAPQTAKPEDITTGTAENPFKTTLEPDEAPLDSTEASFSAKKKQFQQQAESGQVIDLSEFHSSVDGGDADDEDYWEDEDEDIPSAFKGHFATYSFSDTNALSEYVADSADINNILRGKKNTYEYISDEDFKDAAGVINDLDSLISRSVLQEDFSVFRGVAMKKDSLDAFLDSKMYQDLAFTSTSENSGLANGWSAVDPELQPDRVQVTMEIKLPAGFTAHRVDYLAADAKMYANEQEVLLPRGSKFGIVGVEEGSGGIKGSKNVHLIMEPVLNDSNFKTEGIKNGKNNTGDSGDTNGNLPAASEAAEESNDNGGAGYDNSDSGTSPAGDAGQPESEELQDPVTPEASSEEHSELDKLIEAVESKINTPAKSASEEPKNIPEEGEEIAPINGADAILFAMAGKEGISVDALKNNLGIGTDGKFPNKGKKVTNDSGDAFEANAIVTNPKFGEGIASIILPSTNSVKVLYKDHGFKVTQAKNLSLVDGTVPDEVASEALDLSKAAPGDVGTNPANGKMYFVDKNGNAQYVGDEVEYTKKGITQHGKVSAIYKGTKTSKIEWDDDTASVKKASQLIGKKESSKSDSDSSETAPEADTTEAPAVDEAPETSTEEIPEEAPEAAGTPEAPTTPEAPEEAAEAATEAPVNKGYTPAPAGYDPMGPTLIQILPTMDKATVYPHDHSQNEKESYKLKGVVKYNPVEEQYFGVGHNLQPLYAGDKVSYLFGGKKSQGEIIVVKPKSESAVVLLDDGQTKLKKFSQLSGNQPKTVDVDENGNYTDWYGNAQQIPNFKKSDSSGTPEASEAPAESAPEAPEVPETVEPEAPKVSKPEWGDVVASSTGQSLIVDGKTYVKLPYLHSSNWWDPETHTFIEPDDLFNKLDSSSSDVVLNDIPTPNYGTKELDELGNQAKISSRKLGITFTRDSDGDWYSDETGYVKSWGIVQHIPSDDWMIESKGEEKPNINLSDHVIGDTIIIGDDTFVKLGGTYSPAWWNTSSQISYDDDDMLGVLMKADNSTVRTGESLESSLTEEDKSSFHEGAELSSEKLGLTITKDSDGDWAADTGGFGYIHDENVFDVFVTDDWEINEYGQAKSNISEYDLDAANGYATLYSEKLDKNFEKDSEGSWISNGSGDSYTAEELLSEFPSDDWYVEDSEIDDDYEYSVDVSGLNLGSKISHTDSPHESPDDYQLIAEDTWALLDVYGKPTGTTYTSETFSDGYGKITHAADDDEGFEAPQAYTYESNTPNIDKKDISLDWLKAAPEGTIIKSGMSDKWSYEKNSEGKWETTDGWGVKTGMNGTDEQVYDASVDKHDLTDIYMPESAEPVSDVFDISTVEVGTYIPHNGSDTTGYTKVDSNAWKMKVGDQEVDYLLEDDFIDAFVKATAPEIQQPKPVETPATSEPEANLPETDAPTTEAPEDTTSIPALSDMTLSEFKALPVGTKLTSNSGMAVYEKKGNNSWENTSNEYGTTLEDTVFTNEDGPISIIHEYTISLPEGDSANTNTPSDSNDTTDIPDSSFPEMTSKSFADISIDEFDNLPIGSKVLYNSGSEYNKVNDDGWESASGMIIENKHFYDGIEIGVPATVQYFDNVELPSAAAVKTYPDTIKGMSKEDFADLPVGSLVDVNGDTIYTKIGPNEWAYGDEDGTVVDDDFSGITIPGSYTTTVLTVPSEASSQPAPDLKNMTSDEFSNLPTGTKLVNGIGGNFEKIGPNKWKVENDETNLKMSDDAFVISGAPSSYVKSYTVELPNNNNNSNNSNTETAPTAPAPQPTSKPIFGMDKQEILNAPVGSTVTAPGGSVMTKGSDGVWTSDTSTQSDDTGSGIAWLTNKEVGKSYIFTPAPALKSLDKYTTEEVSAFPAGTIAHIKGVSVVYTKQENGNWLSPNGSKIPDSSMVEMAGDSLGEDWTMELPVTTKSPFEGGLHKGVKLNKDLVDGYPVGTVFKNEFNVAHGYSNLSPFYYVKLEDGTWQKYKQTDKTLSAKDNLEADQIAKWTAHKVSVSVPKSDEHFMTNSGELGYVGDTVLDDSGSEYTVTKLMKTGVKVIDSNGVKLTIKPNKLHIKDGTFGKKDSTAPTADPYATTPTQESNTPAAPMEPLNISSTSDWAGSSAEAYNDQGLVMPSIANPMVNSSLSLLPITVADIDDPLYGVPMPIEPPKPEAYPSFQPPVMDPLPNWDSSEWLKKVEQRYLDNPNKAKASVQESNNWSTVQSAMSGDKAALDKLLSSKYIDQDLMDEALAGINAQEEVNKPLIDAHNEKVLKASQDYDQAKALHTATYTELKSKYDSDFLAWAKANPNPDALKPLNKPALSAENFTGGSADWSKAHIGTHTADAVFTSLKTDNAVATHGLSIATDSDKVEGLDISMRKILDVDGSEVFDMRFKVTKPHGKTLLKWFQDQKAVHNSSLKVPNLSFDKSKGLLKESPATNTTGSGHIYTMKHEPTGATIQFNRDSSESEFNNHNLHNALRIKMPATATTKEYEEVLAFLGIDGKPSTEGDVRVAAENRLINAFGDGNKISVGADNLKGAEREKALKDIQTKYGITTDNIVFRTEPNGRVKMFFDAPTVDKLAAKFSDIKTFQHSLSSDSNADMYESMLTGPHPGLLSTYHRWSNGIGFSGASSSTDLQYGSGDYTYMTNKTDLNNIWGGAAAIHPKAIFQRLDLWVNKNDSYGKKDSGIDGTLGPFSMFDKHGSNVYETMASDGVPLNDIMFIKVNNDHLRQSIIKKLKDKGVLKINGVPVENYIIVSGINPPEYEYFPGFGLVPKGTTLEEAMADAGFGAGIDVQKAYDGIAQGGTEI